jgi:hypothetical protein
MAKNRVKMMIAVALASTESEPAADTASIFFFLVSTYIPLSKRHRKKYAAAVDNL